MASYLGWIQYAIPVTYQLKPYSIQIFGDIANVIYAAKWKAKEKFSGNFHTLVSFKKENGKWLSVSWMASSCEKESKCLDW